MAIRIYQIPTTDLRKYWTTHIHQELLHMISLQESFGGCTMQLVFTIFVNLGVFRHFETVTNIRTWIKSHRYWRMLKDANTLKRVFISRTQLITHIKMV
jgi:hypothetical protein